MSKSPTLTVPIASEYSMSLSLPRFWREQLLFFQGFCKEGTFNWLQSILYMSFSFLQCYVMNLSSTFSSILEQNVSQSTLSLSFML